jgi:hypothetical protein
MSSTRPLVSAIAIALVVGSGFSLAAGNSPPTVRSAEIERQARAPITPKQRGELTRQFVNKWGVYVQKVHGLDVHAWARRMGGTFASADPGNFQAALRRSTFEGAMATLDGAGHKLSDAAVIDAMARSDRPIGINDFGDLDRDLVYTAIEPCRIVDTRNTTAGAIAAGTSREFIVYGLADYGSQGGSSTDCNLLDQSPQAAVFNVTAVAPPTTGFATVYPADSTRPLAASMVYQTGTTLSNMAISKLGFTPSGDFQIFSERTVHYVVDIVGYYDAPFATALDCIDVTQGPIAVASNTQSTVTVSCPATDTATGGGADSSVRQGVFLNGSRPAGNGWLSSVQNTSGTTTNTTHYATCCRVPGR